MVMKKGQNECSNLLYKLPTLVLDVLETILFTCMWPLFLSNMNYI